MFQVVLHHLRIVLMYPLHLQELVTLEQQVLKVLLDLLVEQVHRVPKDIKVLLDHRVLLLD